MIPKIIHYCWYGGKPLNDLSEKCIQSWKKYCPDYEIIRWDESNTDLNSNQFMKEAYDNKKWAFVSDVMRLKVLYEYGGVYMDTDVELIKPIDSFLNNNSFVGFDDECDINTGIIGTNKNLPIFHELMAYYNTKNFVKSDGSLDLTTNVTIITNILEKYGLVKDNSQQTLSVSGGGVAIYPKEFFCPKDSGTGAINITENTYTIHYFDGTWLSDEDKYAEKLRFKLIKFCPRKLSYYISAFIACVKYNGFKVTMAKIFRNR